MSGEELLSLLMSRQSDRRFEEGRVIPAEVLKAILEAGRLAPSACNSQPWIFHVANGGKVCAALAKAASPSLFPLNKFARSASCMIAVEECRQNLAGRVGNMLKNENYARFDLGFAVSHLVIAAEANGVGSCILGWFDENAVCDALGISRDRKIGLLVALGYPLEKKRKKSRKDFDTVVSYYN